MSCSGPVDDNAPTLLMCGVQPILLETRARLLERAGYSVQLANGARELEKRLLESRYLMLLICHSVQGKELATVKTAAAQAKLAIYRIEPMLPPEALIDEVNRMLQRTHRSSMTSVEAD